jgi:hypothetical protein
MQRNGQNPIRAVKFGSQHGGKLNDDGIKLQSKHNSGVVICPACKAEVPLKPGFRLSALKCPKCNASMGNK